MVEFFGFESTNPNFELVSSHNETITFEFADFLNTDIIIDFTNQETDWLRVSVKQDGEIIGFFNILFEQFLDNKRKECHIDFKAEEIMQTAGRADNSYLFYEAQLINNELEYFVELSEMTLEDREEAKNFRNDFLEIKRKLAGLFQVASINERVSPVEDMKTINNAVNLSKKEKLLLSRQGVNHHSLRTSYVGFAKKASMSPVVIPTGEKAITDNYVLFPLVEQGKLLFIIEN